MSEDPPVVEARGLVKHFAARARGARVAAVDGVSLAIPRGHTLGLVGESGSGKTTIALSLLRVVRPTGGEVRFDGSDVWTLRGASLRRFRREAQMIFQDPYSSLDPRMSVARTVLEPLAVHGVGGRAERRARLAELLAMVQLPAAVARCRPRELSGGQRQRVGIARALALGPRLLVCDEPTSALDVSVQAQVLNLLKSLQERLGLATLFISHDLAVVRFVAQTVAVLHLGRVVEIGPVAEVLGSPRHPYTRALVSAAPRAGEDARRPALVLEGEVPSAVRPPTGCRFHPLCPIGERRCAHEVPPLRPFGPGHRAACHLAERVPGVLPG